LDVSLARGVIEQSKNRSKRKEAANAASTKNYRPPHQRGVKGGCSPQNNREKLSRLVNELFAAGNKFFI